MTTQIHNNYDATYQKLAELYIKYCDPKARLDSVYTQLRSGIDIDALEDVLLRIGNDIFSERYVAEDEYTTCAKKAQKIDRAFQRASTETTESIEKLFRSREVQKDSLQECKTRFEEAERDAQDFETACMSLPEAAPDHDRLAFLTDSFEEAYGVISEKLIGIGVLRALSEHSPMLCETSETFVDIKAISESYGLN